MLLVLRMYRVEVLCQLVVTCMSVLKYVLGIKNYL